ncbi:MAG: S41 family peptidase, partial [Acidobacteriota bacterium]|nr:S41 family peptidase [Acidobacteriota bacterium]
MNRSPLRRAVLFVLVVTLMPASLHADDIDRLAGLVTRKPAPHVSPESIQRGATDWAALIDSTWGTSPLTRNDRAIGFDHVWDTMDEDYACWQDLPLDWDAVKTQYTSEAASPVISRGRFAAIMSRMGRLLKDGHTAVTDTGVSDTTLAPGVPLFNFSTWGFVTHAGMSVTPQADTSGLIYDVVPGGHPLGVVPGDRILGYDGRPWIDIYPELLDVHELPSTGVWDGTTDSSKEHGLLGSSAGNWHLFDTIDIVKHDTGEVQHLPTSLFTGLTGVSMYASEQLSVAGVADPVFGSNWVTSGVITGTNIGYINVRAWQPATGLLFEAAIDQLTQQLATDGLIVDFRNNLGGNMFESNTGLSILFEAPTPTLGFDQRCGDPDDHFEMCAAGAPSTWSIPGNPATSYANKVAVLTGPGSISAGDQVALRFKFLPNAQWFGKATSATFNGPNQIGFASPMNVDWFARYCGTDGFLLSDVGEYLTHDEQAVDCNVWLEEDDVAVGVDTVLQAALGWIDGTRGDLDLDT